MSSNARGSLYMVLGSIGYVINDSFVRRAADDGLDVYQALSLRSLVLVFYLVALGSLRGERFELVHLQRPVVYRVLAEVLAGILFFAGIVRIEFANAQAILLLVPFAVTLAAAVVLGENVSRRRYVTVLLGFVGVLIVIRPATDGFSAASLLVVAAAGVLVVRELSTRNVSPEIPALSIGTATAIGMTVLTGLLAVFTGWESVDAAQFAWLAMAAAFLVAGYYFTIQTVRVGDLSVSAPFRYTSLVGAVILGVVLFDEVPDAFTVVGSAVIIATGVYSMYLERTESGTVET